MQKGVIVCGYYVCKIMGEIVAHYYDSTQLPQVRVLYFILLRIFHSLKIDLIQYIIYI